MWPLPGEAISRTVEAEEVLTALYSKALNAWVSDVVPFVLPTLTAASEPPPDTGAVVEQAGGLDLLLDELILPGLSILFAMSLIEAMTGISIPIPELPDVDVNIGGRGRPQIDRETEVEAPRVSGDRVRDERVEIAHPEVLRPEVVETITSVTDYERDEIVEAVERVYADPYLRERAEDYVDTQRERVHRTVPMVQSKVEAAAREAAVAPAPARETELPTTTGDLTPDIEVVITRQREAVAEVLTPGSNMLLEIAQLQGYQAAGVQNAAVIAAAQISPDAHLLDKVWIATMDGKTRDSHFAADGQRVELTGEFTVGGAGLLFPADPTGPPHEILNCRCRVGILARDEEIPDEVDRHTERLNGRDSVQVNRQGSQQDEIDRRARKGVVRAREDTDGIGRVAAGGWTAPSEQDYSMAKTELFRTFTDQPLAFVGIETSDGRMLAPEIEFSVRTPPLPAMWCKQTGEGHTEAYTVGVLESARIENGTVLGSGYWLNKPEADDAYADARHKVSRPSVDLAATEWKLTVDGRELTEEEMFDLPPDAHVVQTITKAELIGFTMVAKPAFGDTVIEFNATRESRDLAMVASIADDFRPRVYAADLFAQPNLAEPTALQMDPATGRIFGHIACFGACHRSVQNACVMAPKSPSNYAQFHTSPPVLLDDGTRLAVGRLTVGTGHADERLRPGPAMAHYDNTGSCWALVRAYETSVGIEVSGVAAPWATPEQIEMGLASPLSGDWRDFGQGLDLIAALSVNTPGFAVRGRTDDDGRPAALVASLAPARKRASELSADEIGKIVARSVEQAFAAREAAEAAAKAAQDEADNIAALVELAIEKVGEPPEPEPEKTPNDIVAELIEKAGLA
ncbi:capsid maturation protease and MuF-like fusion protein [Mycobacterium phage Murdoc]|uniref:Capsid maturation protease and MuF-like fusion protein n=1 Tax=Mycobacterium phage Murdoc TaxID=1084720 RepID=G3MBU0_9CAUD|nr:capsid maturation protease and MuF-like fusion protein [Mycobacterium phage Murdoc]